MKHTQKKWMATAMLTGLLIAGCKKEESSPDSTPDNQTPPITVTADDVADVVAAMFNTGSSGMSGASSDAAQKTTTVISSPTACLYSLDTAFTKTNNAVAALTFSYNLNFKYQMYCQNAVLQNMTFTIAANGNTDAAPLSTSGTSTGTLVLSGLSSSATAYTLNGTYVRSGNATSKVRNKTAFTYTASAAVTGVIVSKTSYALSGGSCAITVTTVLNGQGNTFNGTLTYTGPATASLTLNGKTYTINLPAGTAA